MNLIISAATGYTSQKLQPFIRSIFEIIPDTKLALIIHAEQHPDFLEQFATTSCIDYLKVDRSAKNNSVFNKLFARLVQYQRRHMNFKDRWQHPLRTFLHPSLLRYIIALDYLQSEGHKYSNVMLSDSRDVVFQSDPFRQTQDNIVSCIEPSQIASCRYNSAWIQKLYGSNVLRQIGQNAVICSGVTYGPSLKIIKYLEAVVDHIFENLPVVAFRHGFDQGIHMFLHYNAGHPMTLTSNQDGIIATMHHESPDNFLFDGKIQVHGRAPAVVHQFDRHPSLMKAVTEKYAVAAD